MDMLRKKRQLYEFMEPVLEEKKTKGKICEKRRF